jgi:hypothetical protein
MADLNQDKQDLDFDDLIASLQAITALIQEECQMIDKMDLKNIGTLQEQKLKLTKKIESYKVIISANPEVINEIDEKTKQKLMEVNYNFEEMVKVNGRQIVKAQKVHSLVMESIQKVLQDHKNRDSTYSKNGILGETKKKI